MSDEPSLRESDGFWADQVVQRLKRAATPSDRALILADELEAAAAIYRQRPFAVRVEYKADEEFLDAVRKVAQLARTVARELRGLAALTASPGEREDGSSPQDTEAQP